jgi:hypothetical protein
MPEPAAGQPFIAHPGLRISVGDVGAPFGTEAGAGVIILDQAAAVPTPFIISPPAPFVVRAQVRTAQAGAPFNFPAGYTTSFYIQDLLTNAPVAGSPFPAPAAPVAMPAPPGDSGPGGLFDQVVWYSIDSPVIPALPVGSYKVTVIGSGGMVFFVHDDTVILVQP